MMSLSRVFVLALAALAIGLVAFFGARTIVDDDGGGGTVKAADQGFTLEYPETWKPISKEELALFPGSPQLVLEREGNSGLFVVRKESKAAPTKASFGDELDKEISDRVPDYKPGSVRTVETGAGRPSTSRTRAPRRARRTASSWSPTAARASCSRAPRRPTIVTRPRTSPR